MRSFRNVCFAILCLACWLQVQVVADCTAPGLIGFGDSADEAEEACDNYAQGHCSGMCQQGCGTDAWDGHDCAAEYLGGWTATGSCNCVTDP